MDISEQYVDLDRRFQDLTKEEQADPSLLAMKEGWEHAQGINWNKILESERVIILAEAGSGKTRELQAQARKLSGQGKPAFFIPIEMLDKQGVREYLTTEPGEAERFDKWLSDPESICWFFLDSVDELKLVQGKLERALGKMTSALGVHAERARIIVTCRPTDWQPVQDMEMFRRKLPESKEPPTTEKNSKDLFLAPFKENSKEPEQEKEKSPKSRCIVLLPLDRKRIKDYATTKGVKNSKAFLDEIHRRDAWSFARRPLDLQGLVDMWNDSDKIGTRLEQHEISIEKSLRDNPDRPSNEILSADKAKEGLERLALSMLLTKTRTIRSPEQTTMKNDIGSLDATSILTDWSTPQVKALLRLPIFDPATYGRVRFHHRSIQEFLAARRLLHLREKNLTIRQLKTLLFADTYGEKIIIPTMRPVAAWLSNWNSDICKEVLLREPEVLILHGDPESLPLNIRKELIGNYVSAYGEGGWRGLEMPIAEIQRLAQTDLASDINTHLAQNYENEEAKEFLLKLVWLGAVEDCADSAYQAAMDNTLSIYARSTAIKALAECNQGDLLRKIADDILSDQSRWPDRIIHYEINSIFPDIISIQELEQLIRRTPEPSRNTIGGLSRTIYNLIDSLEEENTHASELRNLLTTLVWEGREESRWYDPSSRFGYLTPSLTRLCQREIEKEGKINPDLIRSCSIANRFHDDRHFGREDLEKTRESFSKHLNARAETFWTELEIIDAIDENKDSHNRLYHAMHDGLITNLLDSDWDWLLQALKTTNDSGGVAAR